VTDFEEIRALKRRVAELERVKEIVDTSAASFRPGGARPPTQVIVACIDAFRDRFGVEPICTALSEHGSGRISLACRSTRKGKRWSVKVDSASCRFGAG
jgi:hypothetical protein